MWLVPSQTDSLRTDGGGGPPRKINGKREEREGDGGCKVEEEREEASQSWRRLRAGSRVQVGSCQSNMVG